MSKKTKQNCFGQSFVEFPLTLIIFGTDGQQDIFHLT